MLEDVDEVPHVYDYLCDLIERNHPAVLGVNNSNLPNLISIMIEVFCKDAIKLDHIVSRRMITIIREVQVQKYCPIYLKAFIIFLLFINTILMLFQRSPEVLEMCAAQLTPEKRAKLTEILSNI